MNRSSNHTFIVSHGCRRIAKRTRFSTEIDARLLRAGYKLGICSLGPPFTPQSLLSSYPYFLTLPFIHYYLCDQPLVEMRASFTAILAATLAAVSSANARKSPLPALSTVFAYSCVRAVVIRAQEGVITPGSGNIIGLSFDFKYVNSVRAAAVSSLPPCEPR